MFQVRSLFVCGSRFDYDPNAKDECNASKMLKMPCRPALKFGLDGRQSVSWPRAVKNRLDLTACPAIFQLSSTAVVC